MSEPVRIAIVVAGGIVQSVLTAGVPVDCIVIDYDTDGAEPDELSDPTGTGLARVYREPVCDDPASRKTVMLAHENTPE